MAFHQVKPRRPSGGFVQVHPNHNAGFVQVHPHSNPNAGFHQIHPNNNAGFVQVHPQQGHLQNPKLAAVVAAARAAAQRGGGSNGPVSFLPWLQHESQLNQGKTMGAQQTALQRLFELVSRHAAPMSPAPALTPIHHNYDEDGVDPNTPAPFTVDPSTLMTPTGGYVDPAQFGNYGTYTPPGIMPPGMGHIPPRPIDRPVIRGPWRY